VTEPKIQPTRLILPPATLGMLGSGQLGRMFALEARRLGYRVHVYSPGSDSPAGQIADLETVGVYDDLPRIREFARTVAVIGYEFENVPVATALAAAEIVPVLPGPHVLEITQHRAREKDALADNGLPVTPFRPVGSLAELEMALTELGVPAVLKTVTLGYDGKGQVRIGDFDEAAAAWEALDGAESILEAWVSFEKEVSVVAARDAAGNFAHWGVIENAHRNHILDVSVWPAGIAAETAREATQIAREVFETLEIVGTACVEFFMHEDGRLLINEVAPRPHNSGHLTFGPCVTSQFEQQLRAICGLPLGATDCMQPAAAMANLLGDLWGGGEPDWAAALAVPGVHLHLYGKAAARPGRKMGHLTATGENAEQARRRVMAAREALARPVNPVRQKKPNP
jgi:5-(carboxyamino)imidazole ribonucleotide synthase